MAGSVRGGMGMRSAKRTFGKRARSKQDRDRPRSRADQPLRHSPRFKGTARKPRLWGMDEASGPKASAKDPRAPEAYRLNGNMRLDTLIRLRWLAVTGQ